MIIMKRKNVISRNFEMVMGLIGSFIGIFSGSFLIFLQNASPQTPFLGLVAIIASLLGIVSSCYVNSKREAAGIGFVIAAMFVIVGSEYINIISAVFLLAAGISALFRKWLWGIMLNIMFQWEQFFKVATILPNCFNFNIKGFADFILDNIYIWCKS